MSSRAWKEVLSSFFTTSSALRGSRKLMDSKLSSNDEGVKAKKAFYGLMKGNMTIEELVKKMRVHCSTIKTCLNESISEHEKITLLRLSLPDDYATEADRIKNADYENLEDALPSPCTLD